MHRLLACHEMLPIKEFLSGWFMGAAWEDIKRDNAKDFLAYGFFASTLEDLPPEVGLQPADAVFWGARAADVHVNPLLSCACRQSVLAAGPARCGGHHEHAGAPALRQPAPGPQP